MAEREYILGTDEEELHRLGLQHRLWSQVAYALWDQARFQPGHTLLDVGCGPGHATFDMAQLVTPTGRVLAVDESQRFVEHVRRECAARGMRNVDVQQGDVQHLEAPAGSVDGAWIRWVLCFVRDPQAVIDGVARALRPGGRLAIQDYTHYSGVLLAPRSELFERVIQATDRSWRASGGDPEVGMRLPEILRRSGLEVEDVRPVVRMVRKGESLWQWPTSFFRNFVPKLVASGYLSAADGASWPREWAALTANPDLLLVSPPMIGVVARKPG